MKKSSLIKTTTHTQCAEDGRSFWGRGRGGNPFFPLEKGVSPTSSSSTPSPPPVRGRLAPSPSGYMHLGNAWSALVSWASVRCAGGQLVLRMEDLDPQRSKAEFARVVVEDLRWLGLDWDEGVDVGGPYGPYNQDARRGLYEQALEYLAQGEGVYPCWCSRKDLLASAPHADEGERAYAGTCSGLKGVAPGREDKEPSLRVCLPCADDGSLHVRFVDLLCGEVTQDVAQVCGDFAVRRADGVHAYQLAVVVDDCAMGISQVVRGDDLLASTARQIVLAQMLGCPPPQYGHVPLVVSESGRRLAKRDGDVELAKLRELGVRPEAVVGLLAGLAGFGDGSPMRAGEFAQVFSWSRLGRKPLVVDAAQLQRLTG